MKRKPSESSDGPKRGSHFGRVLRSIDWILNDITGMDEEGFQSDRLKRQAVERNLEIVSEASRRIPAEMKSLHDQIPWQDIASIGNILRHDYHDVRIGIIWRIVQDDLHSLRAAIVALLDQTNS